MSARPTAARSYRPGDLAPVSGIYRITHGTGHRDAHEAILLRGEELPSCRICKAAVLYEVVRMTSHTTHDWDFAGPTGWSLPKRAALSDVRAYSRCEIDLPIVIEWQTQSGTAVINGRTLDLGEGGVGAMLEGGLVTAHSPLTLRIEVPERPAPLAFAAELRYRKGLHCGFEFESLGDGERQMIRTLCARTAQ